ncbi:replication/maintenance protein RepL [Evansella clarkii]|uniref:replication/maintenance protein RepL n=1 Tax=Evansella clarkii TaxID=79879 RepID=UPI0009973DAE|nr:replication/maintenance protein RepL [Evansella clarkii]
MEGRYGTSLEQIDEIIIKNLIRERAMRLELTSRARLRVVDYLLENLNLNGNVLRETIRGISDLVGVGTNIVTLTLQILERDNIIKRWTGAIVLHPEILRHCHDMIDTTPPPDTYKFHIEVQPIPTDQERSLGYRDLKRKYESGEEERQEREREAAFITLTQKKNAEILRERDKKLNEREKMLNKRENELNLLQVSLMAKEEKLMKWQGKLDGLLGLRGSSDKENDTAIFHDLA